MIKPSLVLLPGAGNHTPDPSVFRTHVDDPTSFEIIRYPGWRRYVEKDFSANSLVEELANEIARRTGRGPIRIIGMSIGGHLGYAAALKLESSGRRVDGLCAIDSFMVSNASPSPGWTKRAFGRGVQLLRKRRTGDFVQYLRSLFWRTVVRSTGARLTPLCDFMATHGAASLLSADHLLEEELSMRLLLRHVNPWIPSLDLIPTALKAPTILLRTQATAVHDKAWRKRCPNIRILEIAGQHGSLFEAENVGSLNRAFVAATFDWR